MKQYTIEVNGKQIPASEYQNTIYYALEHGNNNMIINAAAGAAKTTTMINALMLDNITNKKKVLFIAFNTDIVNAIKNKIGERKGIDIKTFHSLGYSILLENFKNNNIKIDENKYKLYINNNYISYIKNNLTNKQKVIYKYNLERLVNYCRYFVVNTKKAFNEIVVKYDITLVDDEYNAVKKILKWGKENTDTIDFTDMIWMPSVLNLSTKKNRYDFVFIDEAQDTSVAEQQLIEITFKRNTRFICVCDTHQQINTWCGADEDALNKFKESSSKLCVEYALPISYRCPKKVVELAKQYSDNIEADTNAIEGAINDDVSIYAPTNGDMVLCRTTAPLIDLFLKYINVNKKCYLKGSEQHKQTFVSLINESNSTYIDKNCSTTDGLFPFLYRKLSNIVKSNMDMFNVDMDEAISYSNTLNFYDTIESLRALSLSLETTEDLIDKINTIFNDNNEGIQLSTIHKAKGLEADNVFIFCPSILYSKKSKHEWEKKAENNLIYVAFTRAKKTLNFMVEDKHSTKMYSAFNTKDIKDKILFFEKQNEFNKKHQLTEKDYKRTKTTTLSTFETKKPKIETKKIGGIKKMKGFMG